DGGGRVFYPAVGTGVAGRLIGKILGDPADRPAGGATVHFLFRGEEPLELTVYTPQAVKVTLQPARGNQRQMDRLLTGWWREYSAAARGVRSDGDHPPILEDYLLTMLSRRLGLEPVLLDRLNQPAAKPALTTQSLELLLNMERLRSEVMKETMQGRGDFGQRADLPLPPPASWAALPLPAGEPQVEVEPLAMHVPPECFYIRFGRFSNYLWMNKLVEEYGGDISSMVSLRSYVAPMGKRAQRQLALEQSALAELLGDQVIADVAIIGRDTFTHEGAAIGMLFEAKNEVLASDLAGQRKRALAREADAGITDQTLTIAGRPVSLLATPDNRVRSFHAIDGKFHLVTTSRAIVERFFEIADRQGSLGQSAEFRVARQTMPLDRQDTIFVYFSTAFFEGLLSPQYQVELARRMKSVADMELLQLARLAAIGEGVRAETVDDLVAAGLLPQGFGRRPDGSGPILTDANMLDSRRGARGSFLPIPDVKITGITAAEAERIGALTAAYSSKWRRMDPLMVGIRRTALDDNRERIVIDGELAPLDELKYGWILSMLGPPTRELITPAKNDIISMQISARGGLLSPTIPPHYLFLGIQDMAPASELQLSGLLQTLQLIRTTPGYIGSWPKAGYLELLPLNLGGSVPDPNGFSRLPFGLWRRQGEGFSVLAFDPQLLANVTPELRVVEAETPAQIRLHIGDLSQAKFRPWVSGLYYSRALEASAGNVRFVHALNQQLRVPMDQCKEIAEDLIDGELICPLGGKYELVEDIGGTAGWQSTAWAGRTLAAPPNDFEAPLLKWFRGIDAHLIKEDGRLTARAELDVQREAPQGGKFELPLFDLFGGGQKALKPKKPLPPADELPPPPLPPVTLPPGRGVER
ncbi:MAG: hypothetical protein L0211_19975, partial [Planctomycetaceae bacterium]|nr:hypothetical protein [Planctomycetaceae bacterium]